MEVLVTQYCPTFIFMVKIIRHDIRVITIQLPASGNRTRRSGEEPVTPLLVLRRTGSGPVLLPVGDADGREPPPLEEHTSHAVTHTGTGTYTANTVLGQLDRHRNIFNQ